MKSLAVIVPVYNEASSIQNVLIKLSKIKIEIPYLKIVVVNDGSTDNTLEKIKEIPNTYQFLIDIPINSGKGGAVRQGLLAADCDYIIIQDADLEYNPEEIPRLWRLILQHDIDLLMTTRLNGGEFTRVHYFWHKVGNRFLTLLFNLLFNTTLTDIYSGYIIFRKSNLNVNLLKVMGWGQQAEILAKLVSAGGKIYETPITYHGRTYQDGKKIRATAMISVIVTILRFRLLTLKVFTKF